MQVYHPRRETSVQYVTDCICLVRLFVLRIRLRLGLLTVTACCKVNKICCTNTAYQNNVESKKESSVDKKGEKLSLT